MLSVARAKARRARMSQFRLTTVAHALVRAASPLVATQAGGRALGVEKSLDAARKSARATSLLQRVKWRIAAVVVFAAAAHAFDFAALKPQGYVSDFAGVIDPATRAQLERYCAQLDKATGAELALVTLPTLYGEPVEDVANLLFRAWGIGKKGKNEGLLLLLVVQDRKSRLEVGYGLEPVIPDGYGGGLLRQMRPALRTGHYGDAFSEAAHTLGTRIAGAKQVSLEQAPSRQRSRRHQEPIPWLPLVGGGGLLLWALLSGSRGRRGGWGMPGLGTILAAQVLGSAMRGSRGGGGFGGHDSSDSFGGFGGGDSGGGGGSSDW